MPKNLLLADDSITIQKVVDIVFAGEEFKITAVDNGDDAVARARQLRPDVILADVVMPRKNGYEVCEAIKADPELQRIPVLLLAGSFEAFDDARARRVHADGHIAKPFESQALLDKVKELVSSARVQAPVPAAAAARSSQTVAGAPSAPAAPAPAPAPLAAATRSAVGARPAAPLSPAASQPRAPAPAGAFPPAVGLPAGLPLPPGFRPPPGALQGMPRPPRFTLPPVAGQPIPSTLRVPITPRAPAGRPPSALTPAPAPSIPAPVITPSAATIPAPAEVSPRATDPAAPSGRSAWRDPFGLDAPEPRSPAPSPAPVEATAPAAEPAEPAEAFAPPDPSEELDWSDLDVTEEAPEEAAPAQASGEPSPTVASIDELDFGEGPVSQVVARPPASSLDLFALPELGPEEALAPPSARSAFSQPIVGRPEGSRPAPSSGSGDGGEAQLREALSRASREVIERIAWEVVPQLAETIIREHIDRLAKERQR